MAELGSRVDGYGEFNYNWGATALWYAQKDRLLTGLQIKPGDKLVGFVEPGMRSNGMTDARIAMLEAYGSDWHHRVVKELGSTTLGKLVQTPSTIYSKLVTNLTGGFDINREPKAKITGIAHITGGGQPSKLGRMLEPSGYGANINNPIDPPKIMLEIQRIRGFDDRTAYGKWHMGPGMVVATPEPEKVLAEAQKAGIDAQVIGSVTEEPGIWIRNKGAVGKEEFVTFEP
jgi:phosphoribosylformylglycinamidine cyclo-ligase